MRGIKGDVNNTTLQNTTAISTTISQNETTVSQIPETSITQKADEDSMYNIEIIMNEKAFSAKLYKNKATSEFVKTLPLSLEMNDLNGNEKYNYLDFSLPVESEKVDSIKSGDIMLYGNNCFVPLHYYCII